MAERTKELREESGNFVSTDPLVSFLYLLMRDHLPAAKVEEIFQISVASPDSVYTNGWLAKYAENLANGLRNADASKFADKLVDALGFPRAEEKSIEMERPVFRLKGDEPGNGIGIKESDDDSSLEEMRNKGIITQEEYDRVITELEEEEAKECSEELKKEEDSSYISDEAFSEALENKEGDAIEKWKNTYDALEEMESEEAR